jgi:RNA recognition motif-containing protein
MNQTANKKLYVGSLPYSVTEEELNNLFSAYGKIESVRIIVDKFTGQSKGFGFVEMADADEAQKAIEAINGMKLNGRTLIVNEARPEQKRERSSFGGGGGERRERRGSWSGEGRGDRFPRE